LSTDNTSGTFLGGVTLNNDLTVSGDEHGVRVSGGMTLNAVIHVTGSNAHVRSFSNETFDGDRGRFPSRERPARSVS